MSLPTILVVDDNPTTRKLVRFTLENKGYAVLEAPDGKTAVELMRQHRPRLVLQDLVLPDIDGFSLVAELRSAAPGTDVSVLAFSGFVSKLEEARISAVGFDDVITKPIEPSRLLHVVEAHLATAAPAADRFGRGRRLIVADDDPRQLKLTRFRLSRHGFEVDAAADGEDALRRARLSRPAAIVSDLMMPRLDGFGLALAVRQDPALSDVPVVIVTSSYVDPGDRELARRAGANDLVPRTPGLHELVESLRSSLFGDAPTAQVTVASLAGLESERAGRIVRQLERQVLHNDGLVRRCSALAAELTVLTGISEIVLKHRDIETALDEALAACFDAGGISVGALYLVDAHGSLRVRPVGGEASRHSVGLETFFGQVELLRLVMRSGVTTALPSGGLPAEPVRDFLERCGATSALVVPLTYQDRSLGALLMTARGRDLGEEDWIVFAQGVGNQIAQTLALASAFADREAAEREALEQKRVASERAALLRRVLDRISALAMKLGLADVANVHKHVLSWTGGPSGVAAGASGDSQSDEFLAQALVPFETAFRGYVDANDRLAQLNRVLAERNRELMEAKASTEAANRELEAFSYSVAHDLRAPLRSIDGFSRALFDASAQRLDEQGLRDLQRVRDATRRMTQLIDDLLMLSKITRTDIRRAHIDLSGLARSIASRLVDAQPDRDVEFVIPDGLAAEGDTHLLGVVFDNLLGNAHKFTSKRVAGRVEVGVISNAEGAVYFVRDNGAGFDMAHADRLFGVFQRLHSERDFEGTGIGLSTVKRIVERHGGRVWAEGTPGRGATIFFSLGA